MFTDTFAGIAPASARPFIGAQLVGLVVGAAVVLALYPDVGDSADDVVIRHQPTTRHPPPPPTRTGTSRSSDASATTSAGAADVQHSRLPAGTRIRRSDRRPHLRVRGRLLAPRAWPRRSTAAREALEPMATVRTYLPILVARHAKEQLTSAAQAEGRIAKTGARAAVRLRPQRRPVPDGRRAGRAPVRRAASTSARPAPPPPARSTRPSSRSSPSAASPWPTPYPKPLSDNVVRAADVIITMGCGDACPIFPGKRYEDWDVADPAGQPIEVVRDIRDDIQARVTALLRDILD